MATATAYDRPAIFRDAWTRARQAAAATAESVRLHIGAGMRAAWAAAKGVLAAPVKPAAPTKPVQLDLVEFIAALPPVAPAPVRHETRRTVHAHHVMLCTRETDGQHDLKIYARDPDGTERLIGNILANADEYDDADELLAEALYFLGLGPDPMVQQLDPEPAQEPEPAPEPQVQAVPHLSDRLAELAQERDEYRADFLAARRERIAIVNGELEGDAGIAWTQEERAEARFDDAVERYEEAYQDEWYASSLAA